MSETVNRNAFPKTGTYLSFLKMYVALDPSKRKHVFISPTESPGEFNYCCFPAPVPIPAEHQRYIDVAQAVVKIITDSNGSLLPR